jgi:hypothetical protein
MVGGRAWHVRLERERGLGAGSPRRSREEQNCEKRARQEPEMELPVHPHQFRRTERIDVGRLISGKNCDGFVTPDDSLASNFVYS